VSLNIKDPEAHRLAQKIAEATGETMTRAVISSPRERLERLHLHGRAPEALLRTSVRLPNALPLVSRDMLSITASFFTTSRVFRSDS
jgi:hypothetical protein